MLKITGDYACFTAPDLSTERVSYDVPTPSAMIGVLSSIYWKPAFKWIIKRIWVLRPIKFDQIRRNEVKNKLSQKSAKMAMEKGQSFSIDVGAQRTQRATRFLTNVEYIVEASIEAVQDDGDNFGKHYGVFTRRAKKGQSFRTPYLGCREFSCQFELFDGDPSELAIKESRNLGRMVFGIDFTQEKPQTLMYPAFMDSGCIEVPHHLSTDVY